MKLIDSIRRLEAAGWTRSLTKDGHVILTSPGGRERVKIAWGTKGGRNERAPHFIMKFIRAIEQSESRKGR